MKTIVWIIAMSVAFVPILLLSDGIYIPFTPNVRIFEPNQNALIAWDGKEEILILSTNISASKPTKALEIVPMPSEPTAKKGDIKSFEHATKIINRFNRNNAAMGSFGGGGGFSASGGASIPAGEVTFHEKIGPHDINVTRVNDAEGFIKWVEEYLKKAGEDNPKISEPIKKIVTEYLKDGYKWFVFDVVEIDTEIKTRDAIQYQFKSSKLFYPMRISRAQEGTTHVEAVSQLIILHQISFRRTEI